MEKKTYRYSNNDIFFADKLIYIYKSHSKEYIDKSTLDKNLIDEFKKLGFNGTDNLPPICDIENEDEILDEEEIKKDVINKNDVIPDNPDVLGRYFSESRIEIYSVRIKATASIIFKNEKDLDECDYPSFNNEDEVASLLSTVVLVHELGHWISHKCWFDWRNWGELKNPNFLKESYAQLACYWCFDPFFSKNENENELDLTIMKKLNYLFYCIMPEDAESSYRKWKRIPNFNKREILLYKLDFIKRQRHPDDVLDEYILSTEVKYSDFKESYNGGDDDFLITNITGLGN